MGVGIPLPEPVAKRPAQQTVGGRRGGSFDHIVVLIEKSGRVSRVSWIRSKAFKWVERGRGPFPAIADQLRHAKVTIA